MKLNLLSFLGAILFCIPFHSHTQNVTEVEFRVNMNYLTQTGAFNPASEFVDIAGSFNGWGEDPILLSDEDEDGIYVTFISLNIGQNVEFKARINGVWNGREEFPGGGPNRNYTVEENGIVAFWYNDEVPEDALTVDISSSAPLATIGEAIRFFDQSGGEPVEWTWTFQGGSPSNSSDQNPIVYYNSPGRYDVTLTIKKEDGRTSTKTFHQFIRVTNGEVSWWNDAVFYEIFVRSFKDSNGDGIGDFQGIIEELDYLNDGDPNTSDDLGITGIWLMPIQQSPSYHGYDVTDYWTVESDYGTNEDFKEFITEAHSRGIRVIIDYVMNHTSVEHPWFVASSNPVSKTRDRYVWEDNNPGFSGPWGQNVWHNRNGDFYYGLFWSGMPDLNFYNADVRSDLFDIAEFWLEEMNVDGFRLDAVKYLYEDGPFLENTPQTIQFLKDFRNHYKSINPEAFSVGEVWSATSAIEQYVDGEGMDYCFEFDLSYALIDAVNNGNNTFLSAQLKTVMKAYPNLQFGTFLTNHDINRIMNILGQDVTKAKLAAQLLLTIPGIPYIYYGEEIGQTGVKPDEDIRKPLQWDDSRNAGFTTGNPWRAPNSDYINNNIAAQQSSPNSLWQNYRDFIALRHQEVALRRGSYQEVATSDTRVMSFLRKFQNEQVLVVSNLEDASIIDLELNLPFSNIPAGDYTVLNLVGSGQFVVNVNALGGFEKLILDRMPPRTTYVFKIADQTTSLSERQFEHPILVFPNPVQGQLNISLEGFEAGRYEFQILNLEGKMLQQGTLTQLDPGGLHHIQLADLPSGVFWLKVLKGSRVGEVAFVVGR